MNNKVLAWSCLLAGLVMTGCEDHRIQDPQRVQVSTFATGLIGPIGLETDSQGRLWVAEAGTGNNDGRVSMITSDGKVHPVITGFDSELIPSGELNGINHLLYADGMLYILGSHSRLYKVNVSTLNPGTPMMAKDLVMEDVSKLILDYNFAEDTGETHLYNMTMGPNGDMYFTDAGANAIIRRTQAGVWSVFAIIPGFANPTPIGPPMVQSVPTGIIFDGDKFLVSTLTGFPFPGGVATIYKVDMAGAVSVFQSGFTTLVDINKTTDPGYLVVQFGKFALPGGFAPNTGEVRRVTSTGSSLAVGGLNMPTDLKQADANTYYVSSLGDGSVKKIMY
ncbi:ScyD/ScyE family protein [Telluribacter sp. SYSU D00476]|uniref:ScyD/ScyE family protein n=1 Tax=Telluribacter sp. SYSU D00476 TaxID=2811430 RepID=UPI001FF2A01B|nr:ScyD/ScyE family protein [Telluribacter sp. SYSU D00476]